MSIIDIFETANNFRTGSIHYLKDGGGGQNVLLKSVIHSNEYQMKHHKYWPKNTLRGRNYFNKLYYMFRYEFIWSYTEKSNFQSWSDLPDKQHIGITPTELKFVIIRLMLLRYCGSTNSGLHSIFSKAVSVSFAHVIEMGIVTFLSFTIAR